MTDKIAEFIETYGRHTTHEDAFLSPDFKKELLEIQSELESLDPEKREEVTQILKGILNEIDEHIVTLNTDVSEVTKRLNAHQENSKACVAYLSASGGDKK